jgi:D-alanine-D-alanine ligase
MTKKNVILAKGGGSDEHDISLLSAKYLATQVDSNLFNLYELELTHERKWMCNGEEVNITSDRKIIGNNVNFEAHAVIPCFHGYPGETGDIQSFFELIQLPYIGCRAETSIICFNKVLTKMWMREMGIPNTPFKVVTDLNDASLKEMEEFFDQEGPLFIKASSQGSSVGCYPNKEKKELRKNIEAAFKYSPFVVVEKMITGRELEVSAYEYDGEIHISKPGEILCDDKFYSFEEKYSDNSQTSTMVEAQGLDPEHIANIQSLAKKAFKVLKLRHLTRIDFFLLDDGTIYLNEPNTFPGMTEISLFPKMMENNGHKFKDFLNQTLSKIIV